MVPPYGGDTQWTNLAAAYASLSEPIQALIGGLSARHSLAFGDTTLTEVREKLTELGLHLGMRVPPAQPARF